MNEHEVISVLEDNVFNLVQEYNAILTALIKIQSITDLGAKPDDEKIQEISSLIKKIRRDLDADTVGNIR